MAPLNSAPTVLKKEKKKCPKTAKKHGNLEMFDVRNVLKWIVNYKVPLDKTRQIEDKEQNLLIY